jgi:hypothetical protein
MTILLIGSVLLGAVLGRFFKVLVLVPACAFVFVAILVRSAYVEHGLLPPPLEFAVLITSLQIGYVLGLFDEARRTNGAQTMSSLSIAKSRNLESTAPKKGSAKSNTSSAGRA